MTRAYRAVNLGKTETGRSGVKDAHALGAGLRGANSPTSVSVRRIGGAYHQTGSAVGLAGIHRNLSLMGACGNGGTFVRVSGLVATQALPPEQPRQPGRNPPLAAPGPPHRRCCLS